jgi:propionyl-CoA carboxylase beta chain
VVTGYGTVDGRKVFVFAQDFTVFGGSLSGAYAQKICKVMDLAMKIGAPGHRPQRLRRRAHPGGRRVASRATPTSSCATRSPRAWCRRSRADPRALRGRRGVLARHHRLHLMVEGTTSYMFITGPDVIKTVTHEEVTKEELGGATTHASKSGVAHFAAERRARRPSPAPRAALVPAVEQRRRPAPVSPLTTTRRRREAALGTLVPVNPNKPYDIDRHQAGRRRRHFFEVHKATPRTSWWASRASTAARWASWPTSPLCSPGASTSTPASRPRASCASATASTSPWSPSSTCPASCPGTDQEYGGIIKHGAKLLYAYAEATVPKITVITRKAYGGAYDVMASKHIRADINYAFPTAEIAVMGPDGAVNIIFRDEIDQGRRPGRRQARFVADYRDKFANPFKAAELGLHRRGHPPEDLPPRLDGGPRDAQGQARPNPRKKHGNIPL